MEGKIEEIGLNRREEMKIRWKICIKTMFIVGFLLKK